MRCLRQVVTAMLGVLILAVSLGAQTPPNGPVSYAYDEMGRLIAVFDGAGNAAAYSYDAVGNITSIARYTATQVSVLSFTPTQASIGASISIFGTGFSTTPGQNAVTFGSIAATVTAATLTQLAVTVPVGATTGPITVTTPAGTATSSGIFTVISGSELPAVTGFSPNIGVSGASITVNGSNFNPTPPYNRVGFNNTPAIVSTASTTSVGATVPLRATSGRVTLSTPLGSGVSNSDFFVPFGVHTAADVAFTGRMTLGGSATVSLGTAPKIGLLLFDANQGQRITLQWNSGISPCTLYLIAPGGAQLALSSCTSGSASTSLGNTLLPITGTYTLGIEGTSSSSTGNITIQSSDVSDVTGTIVIDGPATTIATTKAGQDARLSFTATAEQRVAVQVTNVTNPQATVLLQGATGETLSTITINHPGSSLFFMDTQPLIATGKYTLLIQHVGTGFGSETLQLNSVPPDITGSITAGGPAIRVPATGNTALGQNAIFTFTATAGQKVSLNVTNSTYSTSLGCNVTVKDPSGNAIRSALCYGNPFFIDTVSLTSAGIYTILVDPQNVATGTTTLQLNDDTDVTGPIVVDGATVTNTTGVGQDARLTFSGTAGQRVFLRITGVTNPAATVLLLKPDGTTLSSVNISNSPVGQLFFIDTQTLPTSGTYTAWVRHNGTNTGSETLQLNSVPADYTASLTSGVPTQVPSTGNLAMGQNARLTFNGTAGSDLNIQFNNSTMGSANITVLNPDGTTLTTYSSSLSTFTVPTVLLPATGLYTVAVDPVGVSSGSFSITETLLGIGSPVPSRPAGSTVDSNNPLSTGLVGLFLMNEATGTTDLNLVDSQTATFSGTTVPVWNTSDPSVVVKGGGSLASYLNAGADLTFDQLPTSQMTVVAKVFVNSMATGGIAEKTDGSTAGFVFVMDNTGALWGIVLKSSQAMMVSTGAQAVTTGQWIQMAFTWDGTVNAASAARIYVNGVEQTKTLSQDGFGSLTYTGATNKSFRIGNASYAFPGSLNGKIAYLAVYRGRLLTSTELNQLDLQLPIH